MDTTTTYVYKSAHADGTYVFLLSQDNFNPLPETLKEQLGELLPVLEVELHPERKLAQADPRQVLAALATQGYYLQLPPREERLLPNDRLPA